MYEYIYLFNLIIIDFKDSMIYIILVINLLIAKMKIINVYIYLYLSLKEFEP